MAIDSKLTHQGPILSNHVLLDILPMEDVMFSIKFTYLKINDFTQDFQSSRVIQNVLKRQYKCNTDVIPISGLYDMLTVTMLGITRKAYRG